MLSEIILIRSCFVWVCFTSEQGLDKSNKLKDVDSVNCETTKEQCHLSSIEYAIINECDCSFPIRTKLGLFGINYFSSNFTSDTC